MTVGSSEIVQISNISRYRDFCFIGIYWHNSHVALAYHREDKHLKFHPYMVFMVHNSSMVPLWFTLPLCKF
jgi:hypothetical protein